MGLNKNSYAAFESQNMDLNNISLFNVVKKQLNWLSQRQEVLAQNIANSDTPKYKPRDLKAFNFKELVRRENMQLTMKTSSSAHLFGQRKRIADYGSEVEKRPYETSPDGNAVVLEEQMAKVNETAISHRLTTDIYRKHINMFKIALGKGR